MATVTAHMTTEELLAQPDNGMDRWLIAGELRERPMTTRNRFHSYSMTNIATELEIWRRRQPEPRGQVLTGDAGVRLQRDPDTTFGVDVVYISPAVLAQQTGAITLIEGVPTLAVEILSPSDVLEDVNDKIDAYLEAGVPLVWILDPHRRTVTVHRPGAEPELFNVQHILSGEPQLPGFSVPVRQLFE
jgi:Uma2 family endonuclease